MCTIYFSSVNILHYSLINSKCQFSPVPSPRTQSGVNIVANQHDQPYPVVLSGRINQRIYTAYLVMVNFFSGSILSTFWQRWLLSLRLGKKGYQRL